MTLASRLTGYEREPITTGMSDAHVFRLRQRGRATLYLKRAPRGSLAAERDRLVWLEGRLRVPRVHDFASDESGDALVMSEVPGVPASELSPSERVVEHLAEGLRALDAIAIAGCPFDAGLTALVALARENVQRGRVDESDFDESRRGQTAERIWLQVSTDAQTARAATPVFTHGDYCLPNVLIDGDGRVGFVDFGRSGAGDRHRDVALALRSLGFNGLGDPSKEALLVAYGSTEIDRARLDLYVRLDELF